MSNPTWKVPGFELQEPLGRGSTGEVWRARVKATGASVALKRILLSGPEQFRSARTEAAMLRALDHPNLVRLYEYVTIPDAIVLVLDLAAGGSLAQLVATRRRLTVGETISAITPIAAALGYAHTAGVVHGDVTPANVLFTDLGLPLLGDLGVARVLGDEHPVHSTPAFIDPSVAIGAVPAAASDVFMLAATTLFALTGRHLWVGQQPDEVLRRACTADQSAVAASLAGLPDNVVTVLGRALRLEPELRCTATEFALDLRHVATPVAVELGSGRVRPAPQPPAAAAPRRDGRAVPRHAARPARSGAARLAPVGRTSFERPELSSPREPVGPGPFATDPEQSNDLPTPAAIPGSEPAGAPPLTYGVRAQPVALRPARPSWLSWLTRRSVRVGLVIGVLAAAVLTAGVIGLGSGSRAAGRPNSPARSVPPAGPVAPADSAAALATLTELDGLRAQAFARRSTSLLARVYVSGPLRQQDTAQLARVVPAGCGLLGLRTEYGAVAVTASSGGAVEVTAQATLSPSTLTCGGVAVARAPGAGPVRLDIVLARSGGGGYLIARQRRLSSR